ncbi:glutamate--tRNA ligase family protein [Candidatus Vidania fulgoroideae]|nr:glutamate--tRNA ligase family protein [Candidatus Vidania fulgoroideae]
MKIITRFAPSPTGQMHIGNLRSILLSYIFCKKNKGKFYLRIDNSDFLRSKIKNFKNIIKTLNWVKIKFINRKNIIFQNKRKNIYLKEAKKLIKKKKAYYKNGSIKFKINKKKFVSWYENKKKILFSNKTINDFIIVRKNGMSTYNFITVIDDFYLKITHVLRGIEHINNTAKQINIIRSLKIKKVNHIHFSNFIKKNGKKISKRNSDYSILNYKKNFFSGSIIAYILNSCGKNYNKFCNLKFFIKNFKLQNLKKNPTIINNKKILWYNKKYIKINFKKIYLKLKKKLRIYFYYFKDRIKKIKEIKIIKKKLKKSFHIKKKNEYYLFLINFFLRKINNKKYILYRKRFFKKNKFPIFLNIIFTRRILKKKSSSSNGKDNTPSRCK